MNSRDRSAFWLAFNRHLKAVKSIMYASNMYSYNYHKDTVRAKVINDAMVVVQDPVKTMFHNLVKKESRRGETWQTYHCFDYHRDDGEDAFKVEFTLYYLDVEAKLLPIYRNEEKGGPPIHPATLEEQDESWFRQIIGVRFGDETESALRSTRTDKHVKDQLRQWASFCDWLERTYVLLKLQGADL
jgi:hypothetical protein